MRLCSGDSQSAGIRGESAGNQSIADKENLIFKADSIAKKTAARGGRPWFCEIIV
jgi:hypothetical protein